MLITPDWPVPARVRCAFTLRSGGVSVAPYDSLNVGAHVGGAAEAVGENRRRVKEYLRLSAEPVWLQQVHGIDVVDLDGVEGGIGTLRADGAVTRVGRRVCVIQVADCMPVLFAA